MRQIRAFLLLVGAGLLCSLPAWAVLGQPVSSVAVDGAHMRAQVRSLPVATGPSGTAPYSVLELNDGSGTLVREYVTPSGVVFGVAWSGPVVPNLDQLLGTYFAPFQKQLRATRSQRGPWAMHASNLVVELGGHMRAHVGRAYDPTLVPANVSPTVIQ